MDFDICIKADASVSISTNMWLKILPEQIYFLPSRLYLEAESKTFIFKLLSQSLLFKFTYDPNVFVK
jgi:hypothetical protein